MSDSGSGPTRSPASPTLTNLKATGRLLKRSLALIEDSAAKLARADPAEQEAGLLELQRRAGNVAARAAERFGHRWAPSPPVPEWSFQLDAHVESESSVCSSEHTTCPANEQRKRRRRLLRPSNQVKVHRHFLRHGEEGYTCQAGAACVECFGAEACRHDGCSSSASSTELPALSPGPANEDVHGSPLTQAALHAHNATHTPQPRGPACW